MDSWDRWGIAGDIYEQACQVGNGTIAGIPKHLFGIVGSDAPCDSIRTGPSHNNGFHVAMSPSGSGRSIPLPILAVLPVSQVFSPGAVSFPSMPYAASARQTSPVRSIASMTRRR